MCALCMGLIESFGKRSGVIYGEMFVLLLSSDTYSYYMQITSSQHETNTPSTNNGFGAGFGKTFSCIPKMNKENGIGMYFHFTFIPFTPFLSYSLCRCRFSFRCFG